MQIDDRAPGSLLGYLAIGSLLELAANSPLGGCFVEFGVYCGGSAFYLSRLAEEQKREIHLYDTFTGIPWAEEFDNHPVGDFAEASYEKVCEAIPYAKVHKGLFPDTLVPMPPIAFCHVDADQYRSIKAAIEKLGPLMMKGGLMIFDDVPCLGGATRALKESGLHYDLTPADKACVTF